MLSIILALLLLPMAIFAQRKDVYIDKLFNTAP